MIFVLVQAASVGPNEWGGVIAPVTVGMNPAEAQRARVRGLVFA